MRGDGSLSKSRDNLTFLEIEEKVKVYIDNEEQLEIIKKAYNFLEELWEDFMMNGKVSPPNGIFIGKNHFSYRDVVDVAVTPKTDTENDLNAGDIAKRYLEDGRKVETVFTDNAESAES